ncbi:MAG: acyl-CoA thioesterase II [Propionibacteriaceae bacterium]|jgi:acyl-CoA thioesterase-2|nr:acyl-CoA thioesterase II [Propionibacteriaceae bacterium]
MPETIDELVDILSLEPLGEGVWRGRNAHNDKQRVFGGQVLAQALMAAYQTVPGDRVAHSFSAYFLRAGRVGTPIDYRVEAVRDGGSFSARRVVADQDGRELFAMDSSFHLAEPGLRHADEQPRDVPPPYKCPKLADVMGGRSIASIEQWAQEFGLVDARFASQVAAEPSPDARMKIWIRSATRLPDDPRVHQAFLAYASDLTLLAVSAVPHPVVFLGPGMQVASINHSMWFHRPARADEWLLYDQVSPSASSGLGFSFGRLFHAGRLIASAAQEGLIRVLEPVSGLR